MVNLEPENYLILFLSKLIIVINVLIWSDDDTCVVTPCEDTGTQTNKQDEVHTLLPSVDGKVMRKLCTTNPPLQIWQHTTHLEYGPNSGGVCLIYAQGDCFTQCSIHMLLCLKWRWVLISGSEQLAGGVRLSLSWCWQASGRWPTAWRSVTTEVRVMRETSYFPSQKDRGTSTMLFEGFFVLPS